MARKDDLKKIHGIGPAIERAFNKMGTFTYIQIARWTPSDIARVARKLETVPDRIKRDNWIAGAKKQHREKYGEKMYVRAVRVNRWLTSAIAPLESAAMASSFVHLHLHTQFSLLDGANQIEPLIQQIKAFGQPAVAMTDHGNMFGAIEFYRKAKEAGIKPIIGCEAYMALGSRHAKKDSGLAHNDYYHLILLARNLTGYQNLIKLVSKAYLEGFYYKPRMDKEILKEHHEGLIALSGCLSGEIPYLIGQKDMAGAMAVAGEFQEIFGKEHFYLEVQANGLDHQRIANAGLIEIHKKLGIPLAGTNDCHYLKKEDSPVRTNSCSACRPARRSATRTE